MRMAESERAAQRGPRTAVLPSKLQLVQVRVPPSLYMAPPYHGGAREDGGEQASRAAGATHHLSCEAERQATRGKATRENAEGASRAAGTTYSLSCEAERQATRGKADA